MHLQAGTEPALLGRPTDPGETTQGLEGSLQPTGFAVYVFFSVLPLSLTLWVALTPPLCAPVTWMSPLIQSVLRLRGLTGTSLLLQRTPTLFERSPRLLALRLDPMCFKPVGIGAFPERL